MRKRRGLSVSSQRDAEVSGLATGGFAAHEGFRFQGALVAGQQLVLKVSASRTIRVTGPALQQSLVKKINDALPDGYYTRGQFVGGTWFEDMIHEVTPREGAFVIRVYKGDRPGGPLPSDLPKLRRTEDNLIGWKKIATVTNRCSPGARRTDRRWRVVPVTPATCLATTRSTGATPPRR